VANPTHVMHATIQVQPTSSLARAALIAFFSVALLVATPRVTHPGFPPTDQTDQGETADSDGLRALLAELHLSREEGSPRPDRHAVRLAVTGYRVRLAVNPWATHPLAGRVAVRPTPLGSPGKWLRRIGPAMTVPTATAPAEPPLVAAKPLPTPAPKAETGSRAEAKNLPQPAAAAFREPAPGAGPGRSVLVAGDSLSIFLAEALRPLLAGRPGTVFTARGKVSSGLARPDFFDWEETMRQLAGSTRPDAVVIMIAANDNKTMTRPDGAKVAFGRPGWKAEYARRVRRLVELARQGNPRARITWVGAPVMADPRLNADVAAINDVIRRQVDTLPDCRFVDVSRTLADAAGHYTPSLPTPRGPRTTRTRDGVHLTPYGAKLLADACLAAMSPTMASLTRP